MDKPYQITYTIKINAESRGQAEDICDQILELSKINELEEYIEFITDFKSEVVEL